MQCHKGKMTITNRRSANTPTNSQRKSDKSDEQATAHLSPRQTRTATK